MLTRRIAAAVLTAGSLLFGGWAVFAVGEADYTVIIKKVEVKTTNANGNSWDVNDGKPDLAVIVRNTSDKESKTFQTKEKTDTFSAEFNEPTAIKFRQGHILEFQVVDRDVAVNDEIGKFKLEMTEKELKEGKQRREGFGQVIYLELELKKL
jgi:hypothetical protein